MGTCNDMCPEGWYQEAVANNQVTEFEKTDPLGHGRSPRELAVKAFKRSVSTCTISHVGGLHHLVHSMNSLGQSRRPKRLAVNI